jgi:acetyltransferase-like isoleucine patch superfamily enzyme
MERCNAMPSMPNQRDHVISESIARSTACLNVNNASRRRKRQRVAAGFRIAWTLATICVSQGLVCGLAALPIVIVWTRLAAWSAPTEVRWMVFSLMTVPSYVLFALFLMAISAITTRVMGWRTAENAELRIADVEWPLLDWVRLTVAIHLVRLFAGTLFRGSPIWTAYLRLSGARLGPRVYVNWLSISDCHLLEFGDGVVIGADAHISAYTVEGGVFKTAAVRLGRNVTVGIGSVIDIGVDAGPNSQVGALSFVRKYTKLEAGATYAGIPARRIDQEVPRASGSRFRDSVG